MKEINIEDKQQYLNDNYPFVDVPDLSDLKKCLHCGKLFIVKDYKVFSIKNEEYIYCPNAPDKCNGTVIDWVEFDHD